MYNPEITVRNDSGTLTYEGRASDAHTAFPPGTYVAQVDIGPPGGSIAIDLVVGEGGRSHVLRTAEHFVYIAGDDELSEPVYAEMRMAADAVADRIEGALSVDVRIGAVVALPGKPGPTGDRPVAYVVHPNEQELYDRPGVWLYRDGVQPQPTWSTLTIDAPASEVVAWLERVYRPAEHAAH
jgi:hypothetical protein